MVTKWIHIVMSHVPYASGNNMVDMNHNHKNKMPKMHPNYKRFSSKVHFGVFKSIARVIKPGVLQTKDFLKEL